MRIAIPIIMALLILLGLAVDAFNLSVSIRRSRGEDIHISPVIAFPLIVYIVAVCLLSITLKMNGSYSPVIWLLIPLFAVIHICCLAYPFREIER